MRSPYKGLTPYEESDRPYFFGRDGEREIVSANLKASRLTVLYGASGVGKTSLLRAGVVHDINSEARRLVERKRLPEFIAVYCQDWKENPVSKIAASLCHSWRQVAMEADVDHLGLAALVEANARSLKAAILLVLDQFEEYLYSLDASEGFRSFDRELTEILTDRAVKVHVLISLREDALAKLDQFKGRIDPLFNNSLRIDHLDLVAAREAILRPIETFSRVEGAGEIVVEPSLVEAVVEQIKTGKVSFGEGMKLQSRFGHSDRVETPYLQLVLHRLWEEESAACTRIPMRLRRETLRRLGESATIVRNHINFSMGKFSEEEREVAERIFFYLVTPSRTKIAHTASDLAAFAELDEGRVQAVLTKLAEYDHRILRAVPVLGRPNGDAHYEIYHDALFDAVLDWRQRFHAQLKLKELEDRVAEREQEARNRRAREEEIERARRQRRTAVASLVIALACLGLAGIAWLYAFRADQARRIARQQEAIAAEQRRFANASLERIRKALRIREAALDGNQEALNELLSTIKKGALRFRVTAEDLKYRNPAGKRVYRFRLSPEPTPLLRGAADIAFITYFSDDSDAGLLRYRFMTGGRKTDFGVAYVRWACLKSITTLIEYSEPEHEPAVVKFDGCTDGSGKPLP